MKTLRQTLVRFGSLYRRNRREREMAEEMAAHLELQAAANRARGMDAEEARYAALRQFGGVAQVQERCREQRGWGWLESIWRDLAFAGRSLRRAPGFTVAVAGILAIGLGGTIAVSSIGRRVVFPTVPFPEADRLVVVNNVDATVAPQSADVFPFFGFPSLLASLREEAGSFEVLGSVRPDSMNVLVGGEPRVAEVRWVTTDFLAALGARAQLGRLFGPTDGETPGTAVVLTQSAWRRDFQADPHVLNRDIWLGGAARRVVGVLAEDFVLPASFVDAGGFYLVEKPSSAAPLFPFRWVQVVGRLRRGVTAESAAVELAMLHRRNPAGFDADSLKRNAPRLAPIFRYYRRGGTGRYWLFFGAALFLHLIACTNAAGLVMVRAANRSRELAVRLALGATRWKVARLLLAETVMLSLLGGILGLGLAFGGSAVWTQFAGSGLPLDGGVVGITLALAFLTSAFVALVPIIRIQKVGLHAIAGEGAGALGDSRRLRRLRSAGVVVQAALAVVLLVCAGLFFRSLLRLRRVDPGFESARRVAVTGLVADGLSEERHLELVERLRERLASLPGVRQVTSSSLVPFTGARALWQFGIDGRPELGPVMFEQSQVAPDYFAAMGIPVQEGRGLQRSARGAPPEVVINRTAADRLFSGRSAVGRFLDSGAHGRWEIVGVVGDVRQADLREEVGLQLYYPVGQSPANTATVTALLLLDGEAMPGFETLVRRAAYDADPALVVRIISLDAAVSSSLRIERATAGVLQGGAVVGVVLAASGVFSVLAFAVVARRRELALRIVLGADPGVLTRQVIVQGGRLVLLGSTLGVVVSMVAARGLRRLLFETDSTDPAVYGVVLVGMAAVAVGACWVPARRASRVDPAEVLRAE